MYRVLNENLDLKSAADFFPIVHDSGDGLRVRGFTSHDPRLADVVRGGQHLILNRPALQPANVQPLRNIYSQDLSNISTGFYPEGYAGLHGGNLLYYIDSDLEHPFSDVPNYVESVTTTPWVIVDPMGSRKVYYERKPREMHSSEISKYTFDQDQIGFREDLMSKQSDLMNRSDYAMYHHYFP